MKAVYYTVTFIASLLVLGFVGWQLYLQWPAIEGTLRNAMPQVKPAGKECKCGPNCPKGNCGENCNCVKKKAEAPCCPGQ